MLQTMMTEDEVMAHPNWLSSINLKEFNITAHILYNGSPLQLFIFWNGVLLFNEMEYKPPACLEFCSLDTMIDMLQWFVMDYSDVDNDKYNEKQMEWFESDNNNELNHLLLDYVEDDCEEHNNALIYFNGAHIHC